MWHEDATDWLRGVFRSSRRFDVEVLRERVWGDIWKVHVDEGLHWFKAGHPALRREVELRQVLTRLAPELVLPVVADDPATGWMVTRDQGPTLATRAREEGPHHYVELAAAIGQLQRRVPHSALSPLGLPTFHPGDAVANLDDGLEWFAALPAGHPCHLDAAGRGRALAAMARVVDRWEAIRPDVTDLAIDHNDLHAGNAFPGPLISDWGDAVVGHPFGSLRPLLTIALHTFGNDAAEDVRRAYLSQWGEPAELTESLDVAIQLAVPSRLMCWHALDSPTMVGEYAQYVRPLWEEIGHDIESLTHP